MELGAGQRRARDGRCGLGRDRFAGDPCDASTGRAEASRFAGGGDARSDVERARMVRYGPRRVGTVAPGRGAIRCERYARDDGS